MADPPSPTDTTAALTVLWAAKGGAGTSTIAACLALATPGDTVLVDLDGDLPAGLGIPEPVGDGIADWLHSSSSADTLDDLTVPIDRTTRLLPRGHTVSDPLSPRWPDVLGWAARHSNVIVDAGTNRPPPGLHAAGRSLLVTRACYLALRKAVAAPDRPDAIILVNEPGRALRAADVEAAVGQHVIAQVDIDPAIARAIDAGLLATRLPKLIERQLRPAISPAPAPAGLGAAGGGSDDRRALQSVASLERTDHGFRPVTVDVHVGAGLPGYQIHGIPDAPQRECRDRIRAAVLNSGLTWPDQRITINIAPAGTVLDPRLDLAIAAGILASSGQLDASALDQFAYIGELGLDGTVRHSAAAPSPSTIVDLTGRPPAPIRHLVDLASVKRAATPTGQDPPAAPDTPGTSVGPVRPVDSPAHQILTNWQQPVPQVAPGGPPHPLGGLT